MSKISKLLKALENGASVTSKQITARFGLKNPTAAICELRNSGHSIVLNRTKSKASYLLARSNAQQRSRALASNG